MDLSQIELESLLTETPEWVTRDNSYDDFIISFGSFNETDVLFGTLHNHYVVIDPEQPLTLNSDDRSFDVPYRINELLPTDAEPYQNPSVHFTIGQENGTYYLKVSPPVPTGNESKLTRYHQETY